MRRMAIGAVTGVAVWFGSMMAAEAQQITPTGPLSVVAGTTTSTYTADVYLPTPTGYRVRLWIYNGTSQIFYSETAFPNPYTNNTTCSIPATHCAIPGDAQLYYKVAMKVGTTWVPSTYPTLGTKISWGPVEILPSRPSKTSSVQKTPFVKKGSSLAIQAIDRDRRRE